MATATLVVQGDPEKTPRFSVEGFERGLGRVVGLRRVGNADTRQTAEGTEFHCRVDFGPDRGSVGDLERHMRRHLRTAIAPMIDAAD
jgi:hypothetical protein